MPYQHQWKEPNDKSLPTGKVVCVGRNYADHAEELNNPIPTEPVLFIKPASSVSALSEPVLLPQKFGEIHYEAELAVLIGATLTDASEAQAEAAICGLGLGLDLTRRDVQSTLKEKRLPWELAKAFDGSCVLSPFVLPEFDLTDLHYELAVNGDVRQKGQTRQMLNPVLALVSHISQTFTLHPGDVVLTGTPKGVGQLHDGDELTLKLEHHLLGVTRCQSV